MTGLADVPAELPDDLKCLVQRCSREERLALFEWLRAEFPIHDLEDRLNTRAEVILEAISRASDLTLRGIRGIIAEAAFKQEVLVPFLALRTLWQETTLSGDHAYDFALADSAGTIRVQVKMQRQRSQRPMLAREASKLLFSQLDDAYVVETQRTRGGKTPDGRKTRPYRFGEFDILAVCLHPSSGVWADFLYTPESWLIPDATAPGELFKYQPVPRTPNTEWTDDLLTAISWVRSGVCKTLSVG